MSSVKTLPDKVPDFVKTLPDTVPSQSQTKNPQNTANQDLLFGVVEYTMSFVKTSPDTISFHDEVSGKEFASIRSSANEVLVLDSTDGGGVTVSNLVSVDNDLWINGSLSVDTNVLYVDAAQNKIGVNKVPLTGALDIAGALVSDSLIQCDGGALNCIHAPNGGIVANGRILSNTQLYSVGTLQAEGATTLNGTATLNGTTTVNGALVANSSTTLNGAATCGGNVTINGRLIGTVSTSSGCCSLNGGDGNAGALNITQVKFGYGGSESYPHYIKSRHNGANPSGNAIEISTGNGTATGVYPTTAVHGITIENGKLGVGTGHNVVPTASLDVNGDADISGNVLCSGSDNYLKLPSKSSAPSSAVAGAMYYDTSTNLVNYYNGTSWVSL